MRRYNVHCLLLLRKFLQSVSCLIVEFLYNTAHKSKENVSKKTMYLRLRLQNLLQNFTLKYPLPFVNLDVYPLFL